MKTAHLLPVTDKAKPEDIIESVANAWGIPAEEINQPTRKQPACFARQVAMTLIYQQTRRSLADVGLMFSGKDHGTVIHAIKRVNEACDTSPEIAAIVDGLRNNQDHP